MPALSQMMTWTLLQAPGWQRDGEKGLLPIFNEAYNILKRAETEQTVQLVSGELPSLTTLDNVFTYNLPTTVWRCTKVGFIMPYTLNYNLSILEDYGMQTNRQMPDQEFYFGGKKYLRFPHIRTHDKNFNTPARIDFTVNPGATTGLFLYIAHMEPILQLTSENIEPDLPEHLHPYLMQAVLKLVEALQNGNYTEAYLFIDKEIKPKVHAEQNLGEQGLSGHIERREF